MRRLQHCARDGCATLRSCGGGTPLLAVQHSLRLPHCRSVASQQPTAAQQQRPLQGQQPQPQQQQQEQQRQQQPQLQQQVPRFYAPQLPAAAGACVALGPEEARHAVRVLRLRPGDALELCDGRGGLVLCELGAADRSSAMAVAASAPQHVPWSGPRWVVAAACLTLKGSRGEWLVEKAAEIGAHSLLPLVTARASTGTSRAKFRALSSGGGRAGAEQAAAAGAAADGTGEASRLQRLALAASKQCLRLHQLQLQPATALPQLLPELQHAPLSLVASGGAPPLLQVLQQWRRQQQQQQPQQQQQQPHEQLAGQLCYLLVGPEGDWTPEELDLLAAAGVLPVGLGPSRLRTETAALAALAGAMLWCDAAASPDGGG